MRVHRFYLFWGIFFLMLGAIPLADRLGWIDAGRLTEGWRLWPLAIVAIGVAILFSRSRLALVGVVAAAVVLGGLAGAGLASGAWLFGFGDCTDADRADMRMDTRTGTFAGPASVDLRLNCGTVALSATAGADWGLEAAFRGDPPAVDATGSSLRIEAPSGAKRQEWTVTAPRDLLRDLSVHANAATGTLDVSGSHLAMLDLESNAGDLRVVADAAAIDDLQVQLNAGHARIALGGATDGSLGANAGAIEVCVPPTAELLIEAKEQLTFAVNVSGAGITRSGSTWQRAGTGGPIIHLRVRGNAASFTLDPAGGC
ncbi:MAG: hypothetical protein QOH61_1229 [Chloroflexota bacterium]|jgi:hypothetical protein|nr:hypothetical protein [Chloroflexota bacterium]